MNSIMYGTNTYAKWYYAETTSTTIEFINGQVVYNNFVLHKSNTCSLSFFWGTWWPRVELHGYDLPNTFGTGNTSSFTRQQSFRIRWTLKAINNEQLVFRKDELKSMLSEQNKTLRVNFGWSFRQAKTYVSEVQFEENHYNITFVNFSVEFTILEGYWEDIFPTSVTYSNITENLQEEIVCNSTFHTTYPIVNIALNSASGTDMFKVRIKDNETEVLRTFTSGDILNINSKTKQVLLNDVAIDFNGTFPILEKGRNLVNIEANGTFDVSVNVLYNTTYI